MFTAVSIYKLLDFFYLPWAAHSASLLTRFTRYNYEYVRGFESETLMETKELEKYNYVNIILMKILCFLFLAFNCTRLLSSILRKIHKIMYTKSSKCSNQPAMFYFIGDKAWFTSGSHLLTYGSGRERYEGSYIFFELLDFQ